MTKQQTAIPKIATPEVNPDASVAVYLRVSSAGQDVNSQASVVMRWLQGHGIEQPTWYIEQGVSGRTMLRPRFREMQHAIFMGEHRTVVCYSLDRFSRTFVDGMVQLDRWAKEGVRLVFVEDHIDLEPAGVMSEFFVKIMMTLRLAFAEAEADRLKERQRAGIVTSRMKTKRAKELKAEGWSIAYIAKQLKVKTQAVEKMLKAPKGRLYWGGAIKTGMRKGSAAEAYRLRVKHHLSLSRVANAMKLSVPTIIRYVREHAAKLAEKEAGEELE